MGTSENTAGQRASRVRSQYGYAWPYREDVGTPELVVRVAGACREWLRVADGCRSTAPVIITILP